MQLKDIQKHYLQKAACGLSVSSAIDVDFIKMWKGSIKAWQTLTRTLHVLLGPSDKVF